MRNGVTGEEIREVFLQVAIYAGVQAAIDWFRVAREAFGSIDNETSVACVRRPRRGAMT